MFTKHISSCTLRCMQKLSLSIQQSTYMCKDTTYTVQNALSATETVFFKSRLAMMVSTLDTLLIEVFYRFCMLKILQSYKKSMRLHPTLSRPLCRTTSTAVGSSVSESETNAVLSCASMFTCLWQQKQNIKCTHLASFPVIRLKEN